MKFVYQYKTKENERRSGEIAASSKDDVFIQLKKIGVRPFGVELAPGFFNKIQSYGKRTYAIVALAVLCVALAAIAFFSRRSVKESVAERRGQIYGDPSILQVCEREGWANVIQGDFNLLLAKFAQPGREVSGVKKGVVADLAYLEVVPADSAEVQKMKRMINWMKDELKAYLAAGGSVDDYLDRLIERQDAEVAIRERTGTELDMLKDNPKENFEKEWETKNEMLRKMGIRTFPLPNLPR